MYESNKPEPVKAEVIARYVAGESKSKIALALGITRNTVASIINSAELSNYVSEGKRDALTLIPESLRFVEQMLYEGDKEDKKWAASLVLKGIGVLSEKMIQGQKEADVNTLPAYFGDIAGVGDKPN